MPARELRKNCATINEIRSELLRITDNEFDIVLRVHPEGGLAVGQSIAIDDDFGRLRGQRHHLRARVLKFELRNFTIAVSVEQEEVIHVADSKREHEFQTVLCRAELRAAQARSVSARGNNAQQQQDEPLHTRGITTFSGYVKARFSLFRSPNPRESSSLAIDLCFC